MRKIAFFIPESCHLLDLAGPVQVFYEAFKQGADYKIEYFSDKEDVLSAQALQFAGIENYKYSNLTKNDFLIIPGVDSKKLETNRLDGFRHDFYFWLKEQHKIGVTICSICNAAFIIAESGLLNGKKCTTHWELFEAFKRNYPNVHLLEDRLFVKNNGLYTSAGISSGIDMSLEIVNEHYGAIFTSKIAKSMLVFIRRDSHFSQFSAYLDFRSHLNEKIHSLQNQIIQNPEKNFTLNELSEFIHISSRHLSRLFKKETGITIKEYNHRVKIEYAKTMIQNKNLQIEEIAIKSGFESGQHFRRVWKKYLNTAPSEYR